MTFAAALFAVAAFAQPLARNHQANGQITSPLRYKAQSVPQSWQKTDFLLPNFGKARPMLAPNLQVTDDMQMIVDQPEGTLYHNYYGVNSGFEVFFGNVMSTTIDGMAHDFVVADDGTVYIKNIMATLPSRAWVKGKKDGDVFTFTFPQKYYMEPGFDDEGNETTDSTSYYLWRMKINEAGNSFIPDTESQDIRYVFRNDSLIRIDNNSDGVVLALATDEGEWVGYADFTSEWHKEKAQVEQPSASAAIENYRMDVGSKEDGTDDAHVVKVAFDGDNFFIGNISGDNPSAWAKGKIDGDKVVFDGKKYLGVDPILGYHTYFSPSGKQKVTWEEYDYTFDSIYFEKELVFAYDRTAKTLKAKNGNFIVNAGKNVVYKLNEYVKPVLSPWTEVAGTPKDPSIDEYVPYDNEYGYGALQLHMEKVSTAGDLLNPEKLFYNLYFDDALFTFYPDEYLALKEEMTDVPVNYTDNFDIMKKDGMVRTVYFYLQGMTTVGVQEIYKDGDTTYKSNLVSYKVDERGNLTGISRDITTGSEDVKSVSYTDLAGRRISKPAHGIFLKTVKYADGSQKTVKYVR